MPKTPTTATKPELKPSKKKRKKTDASLSTPGPVPTGLDIKPPMPQLNDQVNGPGAPMGQPLSALPLHPLLA